MQSPSVWLHSLRSCCHDHELRGDGRGSCRIHGLPDFRPETCLQRCGGGSARCSSGSTGRLAPPSFSFVKKNTAFWCYSYSEKGLPVLPRPCVRSVETEPIFGSYTNVMAQAARVGCGLRKTLKRCVKIDAVLGDPKTVYTSETQYYSTHCNFSL